jgi:hypothetical protein
MMYVNHEAVVLFLPQRMFTCLTQVLVYLVN